MIKITLAFGHWYWSDNGLDWYSSKERNAP